MVTEKPYNSTPIRFSESKKGVKLCFNYTKKFSGFFIKSNVNLNMYKLRKFAIIIRKCHENFAGLYELKILHKISVNFYKDFIVIAYEYV